MPDCDGWHPRSHSPVLHDTYLLPSAGMDLITNTHTDDCIHTPYYQGTDDCERSEGWWAQPDGGYVSEARSQLEDDAPWCRIQGLAWELAEAAEEA